MEYKLLDRDDTLAVMISCQHYADQGHPSFARLLAVPGDINTADPVGAIVANRGYPIAITATPRQWYLPESSVPKGEYTGNILSEATGDWGYTLGKTARDWTTCADSVRETITAEDCYDLCPLLVKDLMKRHLDLIERYEKAGLSCA